MQFSELNTPCLLVDENRLDANIIDMTRRVAAHGVRFRPHVKTHKCLQIAEKMRCQEFVGITVSTLREAEYFANGGFSDILYGVCIAPHRFASAAALIQRSIDLILLVDNLEVAKALGTFLSQHGLRARLMIEIDVDGHRAGIEPGDPGLIEIADYVESSPSLELVGLMTHAGESYFCSGVEEVSEHAELERSRIVTAAEILRAKGIAVREVSVGSTPTMRYARSLEGVTEARPGVFAFYDLVMAGIGVCTTDELALSVLATVIGHKRSTRRLIIDAGGLALSKDRGTAGQEKDCGFGLVMPAAGGLPIAGLTVGYANQEHGMIDLTDSCSFDDFPIGSQLRILPNHACMTAAAYDEYVVVDERSAIVDTWRRCGGW